MDKLLEQIPVERETKAALLGQASRLHPLYQLMMAQESGEWAQARKAATQLQISDEEVAAYWWQALEWAQQVSRSV